MVIEPVESPYLAPIDGGFRLTNYPTSPTDGVPDNKQLRKKLDKQVDELDEWQRRLYAADTHSVLVVFQAMDAAGKDSTIRAVMRGINPAGCQTHSFKQPSKEELDHDFLWRSAIRMPERGRIGVFNRSYYEEVLVVRVHPEYLGGQRVAIPNDLNELWHARYESICEHERHLARNGTLILKFFLNVSKEEQRQRFLSRLTEPEKYWKFSAGDVRERGLWNEYMHAYEQAIAATSRPWAPWYVIPADYKPYMRWAVARIVKLALKRLGPNYPEVHPDDLARFDEMREQLGLA